jgi:hypothetical protein
MARRRPKIPVHLFQPKEGTISFFLENGQVYGFRLDIPLEPFNSGLEYVSQPEKTHFVLESNRLSVKTLAELEGRTFNIGKGPPDSDGSIYIGSAHNPVDLRSITFKKLHPDKHIEIHVSLFCQFDYEGVGENEAIELDATVVAETRGT